MNICYLSTLGNLSILVSAFPIPVTYWQRETTSVRTVSVPKTDAFCSQSPHPVRGAVTDIDAMTIPIRLMVPVRAVPHHAVCLFELWQEKLIRPPESH